MIEMFKLYPSTIIFIKGHIYIMLAMVNFAFAIVFITSFAAFIMNAYSIIAQKATSGAIGSMFLSLLLIIIFGVATYVMFKYFTKPYRHYFTDYARSHIGNIK